VLVSTRVELWYVNSPPPPCWDVFPDKVFDSGRLH
jgi:hypothetical protein